MQLIYLSRLWMHYLATFVCYMVFSESYFATRKRQGLYSPDNNMQQFDFIWWYSLQARRNCLSNKMWLFWPLAFLLKSNKLNFRRKPFKFNTQKQPGFQLESILANKWWKHHVIEDAPTSLNVIDQTEIVKEKKHQI